MLGSGGAKRLGSTGRAAGVGAWSFNEKGKKNNNFGDIPSGKLT
jgi:hypothetical protein